MLDLLIDLMTCINAIGKTNTIEDHKRRLKDAIESLHAIETRLQKNLTDLENSNPKPHISF